MHSRGVRQCPQSGPFTAPQSNKFSISWTHLTHCHIDLFASHLNHQLPTFCTRHAHPLAWATDSLSLNWSGLFGYAFPPISLLPRVLQKIKQESCKIILVAPLWPRQAWFPQSAPRSSNPTTYRPTETSRPVVTASHKDPTPRS